MLLYISGLRSVYTTEKNMWNRFVSFYRGVCVCIHCCVCFWLDFFSSLTHKVKISCNLFPYVPYLMFVYEFVVRVCVHVFAVVDVGCGCCRCLLFFFSTILHRFFTSFCISPLYSLFGFFTAQVIWVYSLI